MRRRKNVVMFPPAAATILGTLGGLFFREHCTSRGQLFGSIFAEAGVGAGTTAAAGDSLVTTVAAAAAGEGPAGWTEWGLPVLFGITFLAV
ncbi:MAG: hypothetical protein PHV64_06420, partial [Bacteroidales bacterium]|nr:hypothetical protein [Bacteroidales bacterium]